MKKKYIKIAAVLCGALLALSGCGTGSSKAVVEEPTVVTIWNYYNGSQKEQFDLLVEQFNESVGQEENIIIESVSKGAIDELAADFDASLSKKAGAEPLPDLCAAYADVAYEANEQGVVADMMPYFTEAELDEYVEGYIDEGRFEAEDTLKIFPVAKSTEILTLNLTDWEPFANETGATIEDLSTWEGITKIAEEYYNWSDGHAFFGRDAFANYMFTGSKQLGHEIYSIKDGEPILDFDKDTMKTLWDNFYVPYINGYFLSEGKFSSDDLKTGNIIAYVGSSSGATYTPEEVTYEDGSRHPIECTILPVPNFQGQEPYAVQQGAGMILLKSDDKRQQAAATFLKWFTDKDRNLDYAAGSGYLPVKKDANQVEFLENKIEENEIQVSDILKETLIVGIEQVSQSQMYTTKPFAAGRAARTVLNTTMDDMAKKNRAEVVALIQGGMSPEEAVAQYNTDEYFEEWYNDTYKQLTNLGQ